MFSKFLWGIALPLALFAALAYGVVVGGNLAFHRLKTTLWPDTPEQQAQRDLAKRVRLAHLRPASVPEYGWQREPDILVRESYQANGWQEQPEVVTFAYNPATADIVFSGLPASVTGLSRDGWSSTTQSLKRYFQVEIAEQQTLVVEQVAPQPVAPRTKRLRDEQVRKTPQRRQVVERYEGDPQFEVCGNANLARWIPLQPTNPAKPGFYLDHTDYGLWVRWKPGTERPNRNYQITLRLEQPTTAQQQQEFVVRTMKNLPSHSTIMRGKPNTGRWGEILPVPTPPGYRVSASVHVMVLEKSGAVIPRHELANMPILVVVGSTKHQLRQNHDSYTAALNDELSVYHQLNRDIVVYLTVVTTLRSM